MGPGSSPSGAATASDLVGRKEQTTWNAYDKLYPQIHRLAPSNPSQVFGKVQDGYFHFKIAPPPGAQLEDSILWLNLDESRLTSIETDGYYMPNGTDVFVFVSMVDGEVNAIQLPSVEDGCPPEGEEQCRRRLFNISLSDTAVIDNALELRISIDEVEDFWQGSLNTPTDIGVSALVKFSVDGKSGSDPLPPFYQDWMPVFAGISSMPECSNGDQVRAAVIFSQDSQDNFFNNKSYAQLFMSMQSQLFQAGIPHDRLTFDDLLDVAKLCEYDLLVIPFLSYVDELRWPELRRALFFATHYYGVGIIASGDFAANRADDGNAVGGDPYHLQESILGVGDASPVAAKVRSAKVVVNFPEQTTVFAGMEHGALIMDETVLGNQVSMYEAGPETAFEVQSLAVQHLKFLGEDKLRLYSAVLSSQLAEERNPFGRRSGRIVHFASVGVMANVDLVWRAARWVVSGSGATDKSFGLVLGRQSSLFFMRNDCDQSMFQSEAGILEPAYTQILAEWYNEFNFVGAHYINVGDNATDGRITNWANLKSTAYSLWLRFESEIGSHSMNHPHNINNLSHAELTYEFDVAQGYILRNMSGGTLAPDRIGTAQPGATEDLDTYYFLAQFFEDTYWSGGYSGVGAGYPNAFGFASPSGRELGVGDESSPGPVYMAPNMFFDFSLNQFNGLSPEEALEFWKDELAYLTGPLANMPMIHWPIHDYGPTDWDEEGLKLGGKNLYSRAQFDEVIRIAHGKGTEFITPMQFSDRIRTFDKAALFVSQTAPGVYTITVPEVAGRSLGSMAIQLQDAGIGNAVIDSVDDWPAHSDTKVFLPRKGGSFTVRTSGSARGPEEAKVRIAKIGMRMELVSVSGDGSELEFKVRGQGDVTVQLVPEYAEMQIYGFHGASHVRYIGSTAVLSFYEFAQHNARVTVLPTSAPTTGAPSTAPSASPSVGPTTPNPMQTPKQPPSVSSGLGTSPAEESSSAGGIVGGLFGALVVLAGAGFLYKRHKAKAAEVDAGSDTGSVKYSPAAGGPSRDESII